MMKPVCWWPEGAAQAHRLRRGRGAACCEPARWWWSTRPGAPTLIGRPAVIAQRIERFGLRLARRASTTTSSTSSRTTTLPRVLADLSPADGAPRRDRAAGQRSSCAAASSPIGAMMLRRGDVHGLICGTWGTKPDAPELHRRGDRQAPSRRALLRRDERADAAGPPVFIVDTMSTTTRAPRCWPRSR